MYIFVCWELRFFNEQFIKNEINTLISPGMFLGRRGAIHNRCSRILIQDPKYLLFGSWTEMTMQGCLFISIINFLLFHWIQSLLLQITTTMNGELIMLCSFLLLVLFFYWTVHGQPPLYLFPLSGSTILRALVQPPSQMGQP